MSFFKKLFSSKNDHKPPISHGESGINEVGYRTYVGGLWDEIGKLQFNFLKEEGLLPSSIFIDVACGSLRAGRHIIPYLNEGNYLGIDKEQKLINLGLEHELKDIIKDNKKPEFIISDSFAFEEFSKTPNFGIAQSLFTHLTPKDINKCFKNLYENYSKGGVFYATYFITDGDFINPKKAHDHGIFKYTIEQTLNFGTNNGWESDFIGDWNHPRNQQIVKYTKN